MGGQAFTVGVLLTYRRRKKAAVSGDCGENREQN
jgi:hypothetical protein